MAADPQRTEPSSRPAAMAEEPQQLLARKLLDLWQDHLSALAQDPTLLAQALKLMTAYAPFPWPQQGMPPIGGPGFAPLPGPFAPGFPFGGATAAAPGPAPAASAPGAGTGIVGELGHRLAELESRLAELERGVAGKPARKRAAGPRARAARSR